MKTPARRSVLRSLLSVFLVANLPSVSRAGVGRCAHCGCNPNRCRKVCRLVREDRKITTTCWGVKCEDVCIPNPSTPECKHCETVCGCGPNDTGVDSQPKRLVWTSWLPGSGAEIITKRKLMKKTVTKTVPSFKWVVEDACPQCIAALAPTEVPPGIAILPAPQVEGVQVLVSLVSVAEEPGAKRINDK
jgi:hypothetical protein